MAYETDCLEYEYTQKTGIRTDSGPKKAELPFGKLRMRE